MWRGELPDATYTRAYSAYVLALLCATNAFNFGDRMLLGVVQELLRTEFRLSDFEIGLLGGPAFATLYTFMGFPIARLAERRDRVGIVSAALAAWSFLTACCGFALSYLQLFLIRMGVSVGEAGCAPSSHSLISDYFPPERRTGALSIYAVGAPLGNLLMATLGGVVAHKYGWRAAFIAAGAGGLVLAILVRLTLREPRRITGPPAERATFVETVRALAAKRSFVHTCIGSATAGFGGFFILQYLVSFLTRSHGMALVAAASIVGLVGGVSSAMGTWVSGIIAQRRGLLDSRAILKIPAVGLMLAGLTYGVAFLTPSLRIVIPVLVLAAMLQNSYMGQSYAVAQTVAPPHMRATAAALFVFASSFIGFGLGPPILGGLSDLVARSRLPPGFDAARCHPHVADAVCAAAAAGGLRMALLAGAAAIAWSGVHYWWAARSFPTDRWLQTAS
jgi:predicted MFS family arabinose efflux permease